MRNEEQRLSDFQPLSKAANDVKGSFVRNAGATAYALMPKLSAILCPIMPEEEPTTLKKMPAWAATGMTLWSLKDILRKRRTDLRNNLHIKRPAAFLQQVFNYYFFTFLNTIIYSCLNI